MEVIEAEPVKISQSPVLIVVSKILYLLNREAISQYCAAIVSRPKKAEESKSFFQITQKPRLNTGVFVIEIRFMLYQSKSGIG
jgi:hypothetical protein